jgi:hypothetical protein
LNGTNWIRFFQDVDLQLQKLKESVVVDEPFTAEKYVKLIFLIAFDQLLRDALCGTPTTLDLGYSSKSNRRRRSSNSA